MADLFADLIPGAEATAGAGLFDDLIPEEDEGSLVDAIPGGRTVAEAAKGVPEGAIGVAGSALQGAAGAQKAAQHSAADFGRQQLEIMDRIDRGEDVPEMDDAMGYRHMDPGQRQQARARLEQAQASFDPGTVEDSALYRAGSEVQEFGRELTPAAPGWEDSMARKVGAGLGSVAGGVATSVATGPVGAGAVFTLAGSGEAVDRAVKNGATEEEIIQAAKAGQIPGMTDSLPVETLLGRIPLPGGKFIKIPANALGAVLKAGRRIGFQALVEGIQEGGQEFLQNLIQQQYDEEQGATEGVGESATVGGVVGGVMGALIPGRDRGASATSAQPEQQAEGKAGMFDDLVPEGALPAEHVLGREEAETAPAEVDGAVSLPEIVVTPEGDPDPERLNSPRLTPEDRASPIPNDLIDDGKAVLEDALKPRPPVQDAERRTTRVDPSPIQVPEAGPVATREIMEGARDIGQKIGQPAEESPERAPIAEDVAPMVRVGGRGVVFPDALHARLYRFGETIEAGQRPDARETRELLDAFKGFVVEEPERDVRFENWRDVGELALDYRRSIAEEAAKGGGTLQARDALADDAARVAWHRRGAPQPQRERERGRVSRLPQDTERRKESVDPSPIQPEAAPQPVKRGEPELRRSETEFGYGQTELGQREVPEPADRQPIADTPPQGERPPRDPIPAREVEADTAVTTAGRSVPVRYAVVEADTLVPSQRDGGGANPDYPSELQPRDRARATSDAQVVAIARNLNPRLLGKSPRASDGAPIVASDGVVESGNGRVLAIRRAYDEGRADTYRDYLTDKGYPVDGMNRPVLVRIRDGEMAPADRQAFTREANERDTLAMSATEQAMADAQAMPRDLVSLYRGGDVDAAGNRDFVRRFIRDVAGQNEQSRMIGPDGAVSHEAVRRVQGALLGKAYGDPDLVASLVESTDNNIKAIGGAAMDVAAEWAQMREDAAEGRISAEADQTPRLLEAVRIVDRARREGRKIGELVGQRDMFTGEATDRRTEGFLRLMFRNQKSWTQPVGREKIAEALRLYATEMRKTSAEPDLLGETAPSPEQVLTLAQERQYGRQPNQDALEFGTQVDAGVRQGVRPLGDGGAVEAERAVDAGSGAGRPREGDQPEGEVAPTGTDVPRAKLAPAPATEDAPASSGAFRIRTGAAGFDVESVLTESFVEKADALSKRLRKDLDGLGLKDIGLRVSESISMIVNGERGEADGVYFKNLIDIALDADDPASTLNHEAVHALRNLRLFSETEWSILTRKSKSEWMDRYNIRDSYADFPEWAQIEEGVAHAYASWAAGKKTDGILARTFKRIKAFLESLGSALRGEGFTSPDAVFSKISKGEVGERPRDEKGRFVKADVPAPSLREPVTVADRQQHMQGMLAKGQPIDRVIRMPFEWFGGLTEDGQWKPGQKIAEAATKALTSAKFSPDGRLAWINPTLETARAGLIDRYGLDADYVDRERGRKLDERRIMFEGAEILKTLKDQNVGVEEARVLQAVLTGKDVADADMKKLAVPIREAIDRLGQEAVTLGLLSEESYERNRGAYLHRVYTKHEADQNALVKFTNRIMNASRKKIVGDQFKGRGIFFDVDAARLKQDMGGAPEKGAKIRILDRLGGETQKVTKRVYISADRTVPEEYDGFTDRGVWEVRGTKNGKAVLWRDYTEAERASMGEILDARYTIGKTFMLMAHDLATGRFYKDIAANPEWATATEPEGSWKNGDEVRRGATDSSLQWVKVPDTDIPKSGGKKRWGALSDKWVRAEIWRDLNEIEIMQRPHWWRTLMTQWKLNKTARHPVVHMNNVMSNLVFMDLADIRTQDLFAGIRSFVKEDKHFQEAAEHGAFGSDMMSQEIRDNVLRPILEDITKDMQDGAANSFLARAKILGKIADRVYTTAVKLDRKMIDAYRAEDEIFRMATYVRRRQLGDTPQQAADFARQQFLDYDIRAPWVNAARNTVLPFISYTYRAAPLVAKAVMTRPWKLAKYYIIAEALNALAYGWDDEADEERERASLRDHEQGYAWIGVPRMLRMPFRNEDGLPVFLDIRRWIPAGDVFDTNQGSSAVPIPAPLQFGGPLMIGAELALNKQGFTGEDITNRKTDTLWEQGGDAADYLWKAWLPSAAWVPNSWYWEKIGNAMSGATDRQGRPYDVGTAVASSFGVKLKPQDVDEGLYWQGFEIRKIEQELKGQARRLARQRDRNLVSEREFNQGMHRIMEKMGRLQGRARKLQDAASKD